MRKLLTVVCWLVGTILGQLLFAQEQKVVIGESSITRDDALEIAKRSFANQDVDYYLVNDSSKTCWKVFVDAEPLKGWEHKCYVLTIPKQSTQSKSEIEAQKTEYKLPPKGNYIPLSISNKCKDVPEREGIQKTSNIDRYILPVPDDHATSKFYAVILSGGVNYMANYERYWNDCSYLYKTLRQRYRIERDHIIPIMADGNCPEIDMIKNDGQVVSQPLDLDGDGTSDIELAATKYNVRTQLNYLASIMTEDDHLLFYVIDHGGRDQMSGYSYINLWNDEKLSSYELASMLSPFKDRYVNVNVVLGQCYSGGFLDALNQKGCVVTTACTDNQYSYATADGKYDTFVYLWTSAINGTDHRGFYVGADYDGNGYVSMAEAYRFVCESYHNDNETARYYSLPNHLGNDLAVNHIAPAIDLYIPDNDADVGDQPNLTTEVQDASPSIWIRHNDDGGLEHQNPYFNAQHDTNYVYIRVQNRGRRTYSLGEHCIHAYWAKGSGDIPIKTWYGIEDSILPQIGGKVGCVEIGGTYIGAGESIIVKIPWQDKDDKISSERGISKYSILARILHHEYECPYDSYLSNGAKFYVLENKKIAQKSFLMDTRIRFRFSSSNRAIKSVDLSELSSIVKVHLENQAPEGSQLRVVSLINGKECLTAEIEGKQIVELDMSTLPAGQYCLIYCEDSRNLDQYIVQVP